MSIENREYKMKRDLVTKESMLLYAVTDRMWLGEESLPQQVERAIQGGTTFVQLREKHLGKEEFIRLAEEVKAVTDRYGIPFVINDEVEVAIACNADGVHIGQHDMTLREVRRRLGDDKIIGVSAQTVEQAVEAEQNGADYLGVGAVFSTDTKADASEVPFDTLREICTTVTIPVVAIGGIKSTNVAKLEGTGVDGIAVVSALFAAKDIKQEATLLRSKSEDMVAICRE